jgi:hypothetical protein
VLYVSSKDFKEIVQDYVKLVQMYIENNNSKTEVSIVRTEDDTKTKLRVNRKLRGFQSLQKWWNNLLRRLLLVLVTTTQQIYANSDISSITKNNLLTINSCNNKMNYILYLTAIEGGVY